MTFRERGGGAVVSSKRVRLTEKTPRSIVHGISLGFGQPIPGHGVDGVLVDVDSMPLRRVARRIHRGQVQETGLTEQRLAEFLGKGGGALPLQAAWCASFIIGGYISACSRCPPLLLFVQSALDLWSYTCFFQRSSKRTTAATAATAHRLSR